MSFLPNETCEPSTVSYNWISILSSKTLTQQPTSLPKQLSFCYLVLVMSSHTRHLSDVPPWRTSLRWLHLTSGCSGPVANCSRAHALFTPSWYGDRMTTASGPCRVPPPLIGALLPPTSLPAGTEQDSLPHPAHRIDHLNTGTYLAHTCSPTGPSSWFLCDARSAWLTWGLRVGFSRRKYLECE